MFDAWLDSFDDVEIPEDTDGLTRVLAIQSRLAAKIAVAIGRFDVRDEWDSDGSTSMIAWLKARGMSGGDARTLREAGRRTRALPTLTAAWLEGRLSHGQVKAVLANVRDRHVNLFAEHEPEIVPTLEALSVAETQTAMTAWRLKAEALDDIDPYPDHFPREAHLSQGLDGRWFLTGAFDPEGGTILDTAIRLADSGDWNRIPGERRGDALVDICRWFLDNQDRKKGGRHRPHVNIVIDGDTIGTDNLTGEVANLRIPLDSATLSRYLCDCKLHRVLRDSRGAILDYGVATQSIPAPLFNTLVIRDRHCRFEGCDRPPTWCEGHHVKWYSHGGPTNVNNLVLLCSRHHHMLHKRGWHAELKPDGEFVVTTPTGLRKSTYPPGVRQLCAT